MGKKLTNDIVLERLKKVHGDKYGLEKVDYKGDKQKIILTCKLHGDFEIRPDCAFEGQGCPICRGTARYTTDYFTKKGNEIHNYKYDYSETKYWQSHKKVCIICHEKDEDGVEHGKFWQSYSAHILQKHGCPKCALKIRARKKNEVYIKECKEVHGDEYDYSCTNYKTSRDKVDIRCRKHGVFSIMPRSHLLGVGCPKCASSHLEKEVRVKFENLGVDFEEQKKFEWLKNKIKLPLDFYLPKYNIAIECQGIQHFNSFDYFGGKEVHDGIVFRDKLKKRLCDEHGIELIYFTHEKVEEPYLGKVFTDINDLIEYIRIKGNSDD